MAELVEQVAPQIHVRFDGRSYDIDLNELDVGVLSTDNQIRAAVASHLSQIFGHEVPAQKLQPFAVDRNRETGHLTLRPEALFGAL